MNEDHLDQKVAGIIGDAIQQLLPRSLKLTPISATNGLYFTMFKIGVWQKSSPDSYWFWLLDDLAGISDAIIDAGVLP